VSIANGDGGAVPPYAPRCGFRSAILLPVHGRAGITGIIAVYFRDPARLAAESFDALLLLNHVASVALENASLYRTLQKSYFSTVESLASAIDAVSPATHGHSKRVTQFALILGEGLDMDASALSILKFGALLHDIGKLGIPPAILEKESRLSAEEFEQVKEHPVIGERIIAPVEFLQGARPIVRHHHERWDGRGYPDRLRGEEIPIGARIVAIADFYDAMVSARSYKRALDPREVSEEIRKGAGTLFDADLAERFLQATGIAR
jgi:HD-GYP domain-containing protein (c-di-GMP phosphodiesterase class II)